MPGTFTHLTTLPNHAYPSFVVALTGPCVPEDDADTIGETRAVCN